VLVEKSMYAEKQRHAKKKKKGRSDNSGLAQLGF
jgi:hypothetical protein